MPLGFNYEFAVGVRTHSASVELLQINMHTPKVKKVGRFFLTPLACKRKELVNLKAIQLSLALKPHINHLVNGSTFFTYYRLNLIMIRVPMIRARSRWRS